MDSNTIAILLVSIAVLAVVAVFLTRRNGTRVPTHRLSTLVAQRADYRIFVGVPIAAPKEWATATRKGENTLEIDGYGTHPTAEVRAFVVAYANGQVLDTEPCGLPMPGSLTGLVPSSRADSDLLSPKDLQAGKPFIQITYGRSASHPKDRNHYATTLKNISNERVRIQRFAGYRRNPKGWTLATVTRQFFSADEFREWYGLGLNEWIEPGQSATDPNNYGSRPVLWAYYCESASGKRFVAGGVLE